MAKRDFKAQDTIRSLKNKIKLKEYTSVRDRIRFIIKVIKGITDRDIADNLDYSIQWVKKWIDRYKQYGMEGLPSLLQGG